MRGFVCGVRDEAGEAKADAFLHVHKKNAAGTL